MHLMYASLVAHPLVPFHSQAKQARMIPPGCLCPPQPPHNAIPPSLPAPQVRILCVHTGEEVCFAHNGWLSRSEPPYATQVELLPVGQGGPPLVRYGITVYTSDIRGAGGLGRMCVAGVCR
jgi:hypothetical protein